MVSISANRILLNLRSAPTAIGSSQKRSPGVEQRVVSVPLTPLSPVHHPQYPRNRHDSDAEMDDKESSKAVV